MSGRLTRRDALKFLAGGAVALPFTPTPWKLLSDTAIWTQTGDHIPKVSRGRITTQFTTCTFCPAACAVRARCVGGVPVSLSGVAGHPLGRGSLCPMGFGSHQLPYHPCRLKGPMARLTGSEDLQPATVDDVVAALADAIGNRDDGATSVAILDNRPGRGVSAVYRQFLQPLPDGVYIAPPAGEVAYWRRMQQAFENPPDPLGYDLEHTRTILSFGTPILDGWGSSGRLAQGQGVEGERPRVIQVETRPSRTALFADRHLAIRPGTEGALALALGHVIVRERLFDAAGLSSHALDFESSNAGANGYRSLVALFPPERVASQTGLNVSDIVETARRFALDGPSIAVAEGDPGGGAFSDDEEAAIWDLNLLVGSVGAEGGIVSRNELPEPEGFEASGSMSTTELSDVPDGSLRVLILDGSPTGCALPWSALKRKLTGDDAWVVSFSPYRVGHARHARAILPAPGWLEGLEEAPAPPASARASLSLSRPLVPSPPQATDVMEVMRRLADNLSVSLPGTGGSADLIKRRVAAIHQTARGQVYDPSDGSLTSLPATANGLWERLNEGACWVDDAQASAIPRFRMVGPETAGFRRLARLAETSPGAFGGSATVLMPFALRGMAGDGPIHPLASKLYRESGLRSGPGTVVMHPETGQANGIGNGERVQIETDGGAFEADAAFDASAVPGALHVAVGPDPDQMGGSGENAGEAVLESCFIEGAGTWRMRPARVRRV